MKKYFISITVVFMMLVISGCTQSSIAENKQDSQQVTQVNKAEKTYRNLVSKRKRLIKSRSEQESIYQEKTTKITELKEAEAKRESKKSEEVSKAAAAEKARQASIKEAQVNAAKQVKEKAAAQSQRANNVQGDVNTGTVGQIVGNINSKIYHVPGQAGYHMNSENAIYFKTEQEAINAGYRKAKR